MVIPYPSLFVLYGLITLISRTYRKSRNFRVEFVFLNIVRVLFGIFLDVWTLDVKFG